MTINTDGVIALGVVYQGTLAGNTQQTDDYTVALVQGVDYNFDVELGSVYVGAILTDPTGNIVIDNPYNPGMGNIGSFQYIPSVSGEYTVGLVNVNYRAEQYALDVTSITPTVQILDTTMGGISNPAASSIQDMTTYAGPVTGLFDQYIYAGTDSINITAISKNVFIKSGPGEDAIDVSGANGNNVLDGSTGSNFLVGGTGNDTFFVDDRGSNVNVWSTIANFHSGDNITAWGLMPSDFSVKWVDNGGAAPVMGLTGGFIGNGSTANITLAGFTTADLTNGKLSITYGSTTDSNGLAGSPFMNIHAN